MINQFQFYLKDLLQLSGKRMWIAAALLGCGAVENGGRVRDGLTDAAHFGCVEIARFRVFSIADEDLSGILRIPPRMIDTARGKPRRDNSPIRLCAMPVGTYS